MLFSMRMKFLHSIQNSIIFFCSFRFLIFRSELRRLLRPVLLHYRTSKSSCSSKNLARSKSFRSKNLQKRSKPTKRMGTISIESAIDNLDNHQYHFFREQSSSLPSSSSSSPPLSSTSKSIDEIR